MSDSKFPDEYRQLEQGIAALEAQRGVLGDAVVDPMIAAAREKLAALIPIQPSTLDLHGERRQATILLADVMGSTALAERVDTETWVEIMNRVFHLLGDVIYRYGGEIDQYRGDGLVAFFGAKAAHEDDPERALRAALVMQEAVKRYAAELQAERGVDLLLRVGINTGEVIAAEVGDRRRHSEDTAMGRAIALAARMESAAQPGTVLVTAHTYHLTRTLFEWQALGEIWVKGVSQPVTVYRPLAARDLGGKGRGIEGLSSPLIGRDEELGALRKALDDLQRGVGGIVTLVGEAGIGKSRLVAEIRRSAAGGQQSDGVQWVEGRCLSYGGSIAYLLWLDMLRGVLGVAPDAPSEVVRDALRARVQALCPDRFDAVYPYLCRLMSLPLEDKYAVIRDLQGENLRAEVFWAVQTLVESAARQQPLVMVCEDLHWADATSLALLERVLALTDRAALLLICVFRPEVEHGCWQIKEMAARLYRHRHTDLWLDALSADESQVLVGHLLRIEDLPVALRAKILDHAEGNPFYVEEIIRTLIDDGAIVCEDEGLSTADASSALRTSHWRATREIADIPIPDTLHGVLSARIDRLQEETRRVLRLASVIGRVFFYRVLAEITRGEAQLDTRLLTLQRQQLIRERARVPELEYIFKHELTREAAYNGLLKRERRAYHRQVAEALERLFPEQADEQAGLLAHHWERAEGPEKAVRCLLRAGEQARAAYANEEAADYYQRALVLMDALVPDPSRESGRLTALSGLGKVYFCSGKIADAGEPLRRAIALGKAVGLAPGELVRIYWWLGEVLFWQGQFDDELRLAEEGLALLGDTASIEAALMNHNLAVSHNMKGNRAKAHKHMQRSAQIVQSLPYEEELRPVYINACGLVYMPDRNVDEAERWLLTLEDRARRHHDLRAWGEVRNLMGNLLYDQGKLGQAISEYEQALELSGRIGDARLTAQTLLYVSLAHLARGDLPATDGYAHRLLEMTETLGSLALRVWAYAMVGGLLLVRGKVEEAIHAFQQMVELEPQMSAFALPWRARYLARAYLALGRRRQALEQLRTPAVGAEGVGVGIGAGLALVEVLALLEEACETHADFCALCRPYQEQYLQLRDSRYAQFVQWHLKPVDVEMDPGGQAPDLFPQSSDWTWIDPFGDCSYRVQDGLEIHAANGRDMWHLNWSAPRWLRRASGDLCVQTVCVPAREDRPTIGGLLLWQDEKNYLRLDRGVFGAHEITLMGCVENEDVVIGRGRLHDASERIYLRLERAGNRAHAFCSVDGEQWYTVGQVTFPAQDRLEAGVHAIGAVDRTIYRGAYSKGTAIRFESFQVWKVSG